MEPLELTAIAIVIRVLTSIGTPIAQGALGKVGENLLEAGGNLWQQLQAKRPQLAAAIEGANEKPMDYGEAVLELQTAAKQDPEIREAVEQLATEAQADPELAAEIEKIRETLQSQQPTIQNLAKMAEKIGFVNQGTINNSPITQNF